MAKQNIMGMNYVRPPQLKFNKVKDTKDFTEYQVVTFKDVATVRANRCIWSDKPIALITFH